MNSVKLGSLMWEMAVQNSEFLKGLRLAGMAVDTFAGDSENKLDKVKGAFAAVGLVVAGIAVKAGKALFNFGKEAVALASAAEEAGSKFNAVFGAGAQKMEADLAAMADTVQRSKYELKEMAASVQDVFVPMGFAREEAQKLSLSLTQLAVDVGSFDNVADGEAMAAFQSALVGNHEAVRRFGIVITEATLKQELLNMGIEGGVQKATEMEKVQARLNLIYKMTADAQGDAARTADSWANTMRGLESAIRDVQTDIGNELLPVLTPLLVDLTAFVREVGPEVARVFSEMASSLSIVAEAAAAIDFERLTSELNGFNEAAQGNTLALAGWARLWAGLRLEIELFIQQIGLVAAAFQEIGAFVSGDTSWDVFTERFGRIRDAGQELMATYRELRDEIADTDWERAVQQTDAFSEAAERNWRAMDALPAAWLQATEVLNTDVAPAMQSMADVWASVWEQIQGISTAGADGVRNQVFNSFSEMAQDYASHAEAIVQIEQERDQYLLYLEATYQQQAAALKAAGNTADLANLAAAHQAKYNSALGYYNGRIKLEQVGQKTIYDTARQYYAATLRTLITQLQAQVRAQAAAMRALVQATVPGYMSMAQAALAFNKAKAGATSIAELAQAISDVQAAMAGIEAAGVAAADQAGASFAAWEASVGDLAGNLEDVDSGLGNITRPGGSGSQVRPQVVDPLQEAARTAQTLASMVEKAIEAFDALAEFGTPAAGWQDAMHALLDGLVEMVLAWGQAVAQIHAAGLIEGADRLQTAAKTVVEIAKTFDTAIKLLDGMRTPVLGSGVLQATAGQIVALVGAFSEAAQQIERDLPENGLAKLSTAAEQIVKAMAPWKAAADAIQAIAGQSGTRIEAAAARLIWQVRLIVDWVNWVIDYLPDGMLRQVAARAELVVKALSPWKAAADAISAIAGQSGTRIEEASQRLIWMTHGLVTWVNWLQDYLPDGMLDTVAAKAAQITAALSPWKAAGDAISAIAGQAGTRIEEASQRLIWMVHGLITWVNWLQNYLPVGMLEQVAAQADEIVKALSPWKAAADAIQAIDDAAGAGVVSHSERGQKMMWLVYHLVKWVDWVIQYLPVGMLEQVAAQADEIVKALSPWKAAADAIQAIDDAAGAGVVSHSERGQKMMWLVYHLVKWVDWVIQYLPVGMLERAAAQADEIVKALSPWKAAADAIQAIDDAAGAGVVSHSERGQKMMRLVYHLVKWVDWVIQYLPVGMLERVAAQADEIVKALSPWKAAAEAIDAVGQSFNLANIDSKAQALMGAVEALALALDAMVSRLGQERLEKAAATAALVSSALAPWEKAIKLADEMRAWRLMPDLEARFMVFARQWISIIDQLGVAVAAMDRDGLSAVARFGEALENLLGGLQSAFDLVRDFEFEPPSEVMWDAFTSWVQSAFLSFYDWVNQTVTVNSSTVPLFGGDGLQAMSDWAQALLSLMQSLEAALALATDFEFAPPDPTMWDAFTDWVQSAFLSFYDWVNQTVTVNGSTVPLFGGDGLQAMSDWAQALLSLMQSLEAALALATDFEFAPPDPTMWDAFTDWVQSAFLSFYDWVNQTVTVNGSTVPLFGGDGLQAMSDWAQALLSLMQGLQAALDLALALPETWTEPASWDAFAQWVQDAFDVFLTYVEDNLPEDPEEATAFGPVAEFGEALGAVFGGLQNALAFALALPATWQPPDEETWRAFTTWVQDVFDVFIAYVENNLPEDPEEATVFAPVAEFGNALGAVMGGLVGALELFTGLQAWSGPGSAFQERLDLFLENVTTAFGDISDYVQANLTPEQMAAVSDFGAALQSLVGGLSSGLALFATLADTDPTVYTETHLFQDRVGHLLQAISGTLTAFSTWILNNAGTAWQEPAEDFYDAVNAVFQLLRDGLNLFADLQASGMPPTDLIQAFISTLLGVFGSFSTSLSQMAQPGGAIAGAIDAIEGLLTDFPTSVAPAYALWQQAGVSVAGYLVTGLESKIGTQGQGSAAGTIWGALGAFSWTLGQWQPSTSILDGYYDAGRALAQRLVDGMLSYVGPDGEMFDAGYQLAQSGIDGFAAGSALANAMAGAMRSASPEWVSDFSGSSLTVNQTLTVRFEGAAGNPAGLDLTPRTIDAIARGLAEKVRRGG